MPTRTSVWCQKNTWCRYSDRHNSKCEPRPEEWCIGAKDALKRMGVFMGKHGVKVDEYDGDPLRDCTRP